MYGVNKYFDRGGLPARINKRFRQPPTIVRSLRKHGTASEIPYKIFYIIVNC